MASDVGKVIGVGGIILALIGLNVSYESGQESSDEHDAISTTVVKTQKEVGNITEILGRFRITLGGAIANAAEAHGDMDYHDYLRTKRAKVDINEINSYFNENSFSEKTKLLQELTTQLRRIERDYKNELKSISTVDREIKRTEGILLSHRRQMGVIVAAIKMVNPPSNIYTLANNIEIMLSETI